MIEVKPGAELIKFHIRGYRPGFIWNSLPRLPRRGFGTLRDYLRDICAIIFS